MVKLSTKDFLAQFETMCKKDPPGSVYLTFKHFRGVYSVKKSGNPPLKKLPGVPEEGTAMLLIRATDGNKKKISTIVQSNEIVRFQMSLDRLLKAQYKVGQRAAPKK